MPGARPPDPRTSLLGDDKSRMLRLLSAGVRFEDLAERLARRGAVPPPPTSNDIRAALAEVASRLQDTPMRPAAAAAFHQGFDSVVGFVRAAQGNLPLTRGEAEPDEGASAPTANLDELRSSAHRLICEWLSHESDDDTPSSLGLTQHDRVALRFAAALMRQGQIVASLGDTTSEDSPLHASVAGPERGRLDDILLYHGLLGPLHTLDSLVRTWERAIASVARRALTLELDEYENWLTTRDVLEDALSVLLPTSAARVRPVVDHLDRQLVELTRPVDASVRPDPLWRGQRWWWYVIPENAGTSLIARLEKRGARAPDKPDSGDG